MYFSTIDMILEVADKYEHVLQDGGQLFLEDCDGGTFTLWEDTDGAVALEMWDADHAPVVMARTYQPTLVHIVGGLF